MVEPLPTLTGGKADHRLTIHARNPAKAQALAQTLEREHLRSGVRIEATGGSLGELQVEARDADLIVTATSAGAPVLDAPVNPRASIVALGAYRASMAELSPALVKACGTIVVDSLANASSEAGDLLQAGVDWTRVTDLAQAAALPDAVDGPVLLKTVGHALWDLAAAELAWSQVRSSTIRPGEWTCRARGGATAARVVIALSITQALRAPTSQALRAPASSRFRGARRTRILTGRSTAP